MNKLFALNLCLLMVLGGIAWMINALSAQNLGYTNSHTKAICTENNLCQDYEIYCKNKKLVKMSPTTGAVVQFSKDRKDSRNDEERAFC